MINFLKKINQFLFYNGDSKQSVKYEMHFHMFLGFPLPSSKC
jgi:hypothetical protein